MSDAFWSERAADDAVHAAAKRERKRAEQEHEVYERLGGDALLCCRFRFVKESDVCPPGECRVLAATLA